MGLLILILGLKHGGAYITRMLLIYCDSLKFMLNLSGICYSRLIFN